MELEMSLYEVSQSRRRLQLDHCKEWVGSLALHMHTGSSCKIVDSSESHLNHCLGLEIHNGIGLILVAILPISTL